MSTAWTEPGYAETNRRDTGNRTQTDYQEDEEPEQDRYAVFRDRRSK